MDDLSMQPCILIENSNIPIQWEIIGMVSKYKENS